MTQAFLIAHRAVVKGDVKRDVQVERVPRVQTVFILL